VEATLAAVAVFHVLKRGGGGTFDVAMAQRCMPDNLRFTPTADVMCLWLCVCCRLRPAAAAALCATQPGASRSAAHHHHMQHQHQQQH
jgi:hypothetical protein